MSRRSPRDEKTLDLLAWQPPEVAPAVPEHLLRVTTLRDRIACGIATVLKETGLSRDEVAARMEEFLGETVSKASLDQYASQAREDQTISLIRAVALAAVTGDVRALQAAFDPLDFVIVDRRYLPAIEEAMLADKIEELEAQRNLARRSWRRPR